MARQPAREETTLANNPAGQLAARRQLAYNWAVALALIVLVLGAGYLRGTLLWPPAVGLRESPYDDEGVYVTAAQLIAQGKLPYRDFFYAHPPLGPLLFVPAIERRFTVWGSPTSFIIARYLAVFYSALTVGLVFLLSWRLWGLGGGVLSGLLLTFDPLSVWAGRHVMLESPLLLLAALAALLYVLAWGRGPTASPSGGLLFAAGLVAALAGGVKLQGLIVLAAFLLDLLFRRRWTPLYTVLCGALAGWLPLWVFCYLLRDDAPLRQFLWFQLLRPPDGVVGLADRLRLIATAARLPLLGAALALPALVAFAFQPVSPLRRRAEAVRLKRLPGLNGDDRSDDRDAARAVRPAPAAAPPAVAQAAEPRREAGRPLVVWWVVVALAALLLSRSFYAHYTAHLTLPLVLLAGAAPAGIWRALRSAWGGRLTGLALLAVGAALLLPAGYEAAREDLRPHPDAIYEIVARYAGDAAQPDEAVFALDAQFPFRAARRPAREDRDRFIVDGYGLLLYHGLSLERAPVLELARRLLERRVPADPYSVMWRPDPQEQLRASIDRSTIVVIDAIADGRLSEETRRWLVARGTLVERQERYAIYRIAR